LISLFDIRRPIVNFLEAGPVFRSSSQLSNKSKEPARGVGASLSAAFEGAPRPSSGEDASPKPSGPVRPKAA
jgi:hypothetical protein